MHDLMEVKFDKFIEDFKLQDESGETNWKRFINYHFFSQFQPGRLDTDADLLDQICVDSPQFTQIHGAFFLLNEQILTNRQDIDDILQRDQKGMLELYFLTVGDPAGFMRQIESLFDKLDDVSSDEEWIRILSRAMSKEVMLRWKSSPVLKAVSYQENEQKEKRSFSDSFKTWFSDTDSIQIDKSRLQEIVNSNENSYQCELNCQIYFSIPSEKQKFGNTFVVCMPAHEMIKLMTTSDGLLRRNIFDDNVRDSQGYSLVNKEIMATLKQSPERFALYNNGITIVCKKVSIENGIYVLKDPQIVNGCQTCNMIYQAYRENVKLDDVQVVVKIVGSNQEDVTQGIVRGANRQNIVYEEAFETIKAFHKKLEKYFEINQVEGYSKIYYERRSRQYASDIRIKPWQKINFRGLIQSMAALFLNRVEESHRHEYTLLKKYKDSLFVDTHSCQPYYLAAFLYLNTDAYFRARELPKELSGYKMHVMLLIKEMQGGSSPDLSSDEMDAYCERLLRAFEGGRLIKYAAEACKKFEEIRTAWVSRKGLKYKYGMKDSAEFRNFLMKEIYGAAEENDAEKTYTGYVMHVDLDRKGTLFGFIEHTPDNIFFHEFDNPDMDRTYSGKKVSYRIVRNGDQERAIDVRVIKIEPW